MDKERQTRVWPSAARGTTANMRQAAPRGLTHELPAVARVRIQGALLAPGSARLPSPAFGWHPAYRTMWAATRGQEHNGAGPAEAAYMGHLAPRLAQAVLCHSI